MYIWSSFIYILVLDMQTAANPALIHGGDPELKLRVTAR